MNRELLVPAAQARRTVAAVLQRSIEQTVGGIPHLVWVLFGLALLLRLLALWLFHGPGLVDASESGLTAANWVAGRGYTFDFYGYRPAVPLHSFMPPLFTALVAGCLLTPWPEVLFGAVQILLSSLTVLLVYLLGAQVADHPVGVLAAALTAAYPPFLVLADQPTVPVLNTFLLLLWLWTAGELARAPGLGKAARVGLVLGLNMLSRPSALGFLALTLLALWLSREARGWRLRAAAVLTGVLALTLAPWLIRDARLHGRFVWISTNGGFTFWNGNNPFTTGSAFDVVIADLAAYSGETVAAPPGVDIVQVKPYPLPLELRASVTTLDEVALDRALYRAAWAFIREQPQRWLALLAQKATSLWWFRPNIGRSSGFYEDAWILPYQVLYVLVLIPALAGLGLAGRHGRCYLLIYGLLVYQTLAYVAYNVITRYRWEMEPCLLILASLAVVEAGRRVTKRGQSW
jgi:hypothetical protein